MRRTKSRVRTLAAGALLAGTAPAHAQDTSGRVALALDQYAFLRESFTVTPDGGKATTIDHTSFGLVGSNLGVGVGYALSSSLLLGGKVAFVNDHADDGDSSTVSLLPFAELAFATGSAQPLLAVTAGFRTHSEEPELGDKLTSQAFAGGGGGGVRLFLGRDVSLTPFAQVLLQTGSAKLGDAEAKFSAVAVLAGFTLAGWLGESRASTPAVDPNDEAPPPDPAREDVDTYAAGPAPELKDDGSVEIRFPIMGGGLLHLKGKPSADPATVSLELTVSERHERLASCSQLSLETGESTSALDGIERREAPEGESSVLIARLKVSALAAFAGAKQTALVACDEDFKLETMHRRHVLRFLDVFRARASRE